MTSARRRALDSPAWSRPPPAARVVPRSGAGVHPQPMLHAVAVRQLQRTAGNRAVLRLLGAAPARGLHRANDLSKVFASKGLDASATARLAEFQQVIDILGNEALVAKHLTALGARIRQGKSLSDALAESERGVWAVPRPILIDFAERPTFIGVAASGQAFEDLVGPLLHGVHTHRIQWYVVRQVLGGDVAVRLYRESLDPRWNNSLGTMWDLIVDANGQADYTRPEVLLKHLIGLRKSGGSKELKALGKAVDKAEAQGEKLRVDLLDLYPDEKRLTPAVQKAAADYRAIAGPTGNPSSKAEILAAQAVIDRVRFERVTTIEKDSRLTGGSKLPVVWTGWRDVGRSKYKKELEGRHTLVPTVVYVDVDPDAGVAQTASGAQTPDGKAVALA